MDDRTARRIAEAFAIGTPIRGAVPDARGEMGRIWRLDTDRGPFAIKELIHPMDEAVAQADVAFQESALEVGLPMPRPIRRPDGAVLTVVEAPGGPIATFRAYGWAALADPHRSPTPAVAAGLLARLQRLDRPADGAMDPWFSEPLGPDGWASLIDAVRRAAPPWLPAFDRLAPLAQEAEAIVSAACLDQRPVAELRRCHLDFNPENVLLDGTGEPVVLDWENSGSAPYDQELASAVLDFAPRPLAARDFLRAYQLAGGPARFTGSSSFALAVAVQSHLTDTYARRGIAAETDEDRARMAYRIDELDRTVFTLDSIERLVDALVVVS
jgi:Ser/Thr protein kinase RdoA (MazF antagonist)